MNTGMGDAVNLAWKLAAVLQGRADAAPARQLRAGAHRLRPAADRQHRPGVPGRHQPLAAGRPVPPLSDAEDPARCAHGTAVGSRAFFGMISQTRIQYRASADQRGKAGKIQGGDRLPYVAAGSGDNFATAAFARLAGPCLWRGRMPRSWRCSPRPAFPSTSSPGRTSREAAGLQRDARLSGQTGRPRRTGVPRRRTPQSSNATSPLWRSSRGTWPPAG